MKTWKKMGIELEGGWKDAMGTSAKIPGAKFKRDGSVKFIDNGFVPGEIITAPYEDLEELIKAIQELYPAQVNDTCGFHIHTSFTPMNTSFLASNKFWKKHLEHWEKWGEANWKQMNMRERNAFQTRLEGKKLPTSDKVYCARKFIPELQLGNNEDRYTQVNFHSWHKHKTVELRLLPMFENFELARSAVLATSELYNEFLENFKLDDIRMESNLKKQAEMYIEEEKVKRASFEPTTEVFKVKSKAVATGDDVYYRIDGALELMYPWNDNGGYSL